MKKAFGFICIIFSVVFAHLETQYFGYNFLPNSKEELICDIASLLLCISGVILVISKFKKQ